MLTGPQTTINELLLQQFLMALELLEETALPDFAVELFLEVAGVVKTEVALVVPHAI